MAADKIPEEERTIVKQLLGRSFDHNPLKGEWIIRCGGRQVRPTRATRSTWRRRGDAVQALMRHIEENTEICQAIGRLRGVPPECWWEGRVSMGEAFKGLTYKQSNQLCKDLVKELEDEHIVDIIQI